jgi:hypothetical protein
MEQKRKREKLTKPGRTTGSMRRGLPIYRGGTRRMRVVLAASPAAPNQYSSGRRRVVALRSASVMIQSFVPTFV